MNSTINRRSFVSGSILSLALVGAGGHLRSASAQDPAAVEAFVTEYFRLLNERNPAVIDLTSQIGIFGGAQTPAEAVAWLQDPNLFVGATLHLVQNIDVSVPSVEVSYSGWTEPAPYYTERWYLQPNGSSYIVVGGEQLAPFYPTDWQVASLTVNYSWAGLELIGETELSGEVDAVAITAHTNEDAPLTSGLYELPEGMTAAEAQAQLTLENLEPVPYLGPLQADPGQDRVLTFLVQPGKTYALLGFYFDANNNWALTPFVEEAFTATFTVAPSLGTPEGGK